MQKSIFDRVFPKPSRPLLPQFDEAAPIFHDDEDETPFAASRIRLSSNGSRTSGGSRRSSGSRARGSPTVEHSNGSQSGKLVSSLNRHDDPFLRVDRAAAALQDTIQSLLDFQSQSLSGRHSTDHEASSERSVSPSVSRTALSIASSQRKGAGVVPVRQPRQKKPSLRAVRRGLGKSMQDFAVLKAEELKVSKQEIEQREEALKRVETLKDKRQAVESQIQRLTDRTTGDQASILRNEAHTVQGEITALENRLLELRVRHRHLTDRATELENAAASEVSSYKATLKAVDRETLAFLHNPPVKRGLGSRALSDMQRDQDMFILRPERRSLELAREQWTYEIEALNQVSGYAETEQKALLQGYNMWKEIVLRIDQFETGLTTSMKNGTTLSTETILTPMDDIMHHLHDSLVLAEREKWNLLVCAIAAELEAFKQARSILAPDEPPLQLLNGDAEQPGQIELEVANEDLNDIPHSDLLGECHGAPGDATHDGSRVAEESAVDDTIAGASNESLKTTLQNLPATSTSTPMMLRSLPTISQKSNLPQSSARSDTDDDEPGPHFLLSR